MLDAPKLMQSISSLGFAVLTLSENSLPPRNCDLPELLAEARHPTLYLCFERLQDYLRESHWRRKDLVPYSSRSGTRHHINRPLSALGKRGCWQLNLSGR